MFRLSTDLQLYANPDSDIANYIKRQRGKIVLHLIIVIAVDFPVNEKNVQKCLQNKL